MHKYRVERMRDEEVDGITDFGEVSRREEERERERAEQNER